MADAIKHWQMCCVKAYKIIISHYTWLYIKTHKVIEQYKYLGNIFYESMHWSHHIQTICLKAYKSKCIE